MYYLMNKDKMVGEIEISEGVMGEEYLFSCPDNELLPVAFRYIESWIYDRKACHHNRNMTYYMRQCNAHETKEFLRATHAVSLNDTFWIKEESENISWQNISPYTNEFEDRISSAILFRERLPIRSRHSKIIPEFTTTGSFAKCWNREPDDQIYMYKRGKGDLEPYCEMLTSEIVQELLGKEAIKYNVLNLDKLPVSRCQLFTNEEYGYVPIGRYPVSSESVPQLFKFYKNIGSEESFRKMLILDAITLNPDRHSGNHGVIVENTTQKPIKMAPAFDFNLSLLPYLEEENLANIRDKANEVAPWIGYDFIDAGKSVMTDSIRSDLLNLRGFQFSFRGDNFFSAKRVQALEKLVNEQIKALLKK